MTSGQLLKQQVYQRYLQLTTDKIDVLRDMISALTNDAQNDAKGSAGDKHETGLSMMHLEQEKLSANLRDCLAQQEALARVDVSVKFDRVVPGSLVVANKMHLFVLQAMPRIIVDGITVFGVSPNAPLGRELFGNKLGHSFYVNATLYTIESIF
ncbi:MAG: hypothetical protein EOO01_42145 [Chitinophagaceae bacterium]|nr:MAG: hypothetical protein EOO01_42145 [Chitinophagaceae bacterium]